MNWLRENAFLAEWLAIPVTIAATVYQNWGKKPGEIDFTNALYYLAFVTSLAVAFNPRSISRRGGSRRTSYSSSYVIWDSVEGPEVERLLERPQKLRREVGRLVDQQVNVFRH